MKDKALISAFIAFAILLGFSSADKPKKLFKKFPPSQPRSPFEAPLQLPPVPPFRLAPVKDTSSPVLDPYACLPKYLCVIQNKKGEKRTTIVHGLHPALRKAKPNVIDPSTLPELPGGKKPFSPPRVPDSDDDEFRDREFDDSFLKQQEVAETMAFLEEKRRQFLYHQGLPKQKIIPKDGEEEVDEDDKQSKESKEEDEKSQETSKEEKEEDAEKSLEVSKEEKDEPEDESVESDLSSESSAQTRSKLSKYKIKKKAYATKMRSNAFKSRIDDYEDVDMREDHLATVPWDDRIRNDSDPLKPKEIYDKLFGKVLPFQLPSLPKIARNIPGMSFLASDSNEQMTTTTTQKPGLLKRMLKAVTGSGSVPTPPVPIKKRYGKPMRRYKRDVEAEIKLISKDAKVVKQIRDPARQCRMIYKGCDLPYDHIMKMVSTGQVLIENDSDDHTTKKPASVDPTVAQDDEAEQAMRDKIAPKKTKPIPQLLAQANLGGKKKIPGPAGLPIFGKNKKPMFGGSASGEFSDAFQRPKPKKPVASLPLIPMRYQWGKPTYTIHGKPFYSNTASDFSGGIVNPAFYNKAPVAPTPTTTTTTTTERPIFAASPLDKKDNYTIPYQHSVIKLNKTHAVHVLKKKPYNPPKTRTLDEKGRPVSFSTVFSEIAGNTGGIHDFFDRISGAFGGDGGRESAREFPSNYPASNSGAAGNSERLPYPFETKPTAFPSAPIPPDHIIKDNDDGSAERDDEESSDEEEDDEESDDQDEEGDENNDQEEDEDEEEEEDIADDIDEGEAAPTPQNKPKPRPQQPTADPLGHLPVEPQIGDAPQDKKKPEQIKNHQRPEEPEDEEEEDEEEAEDDNEEDDILNLPDNIPPFIKQSMIEDYKRKKLEKEQGGGNDGDEEQQGGPGGSPGAPGGHGGFGGPSPGGGSFGAPQGPPQSQGGGLFSFLKG